MPVAAAVLGLRAVLAAAPASVQGESFRAGATVHADHLAEVERVYRAGAGDLGLRAGHDLSAYLQEVDPASARAAARIYAEAGEEAPAILKGMLRASGDGALDADHGRLMWQIRDLWLRTATIEACSEHRVSIAYVDSGSEGSVANDSDKTLRIVECFGEAITEAELATDIRRRLPGVIERTTGVGGIGAEHLDLELLPGSNIYPSAWEARAPAQHKLDLLHIDENLARIGGAYRTMPAIKMQLVRRAQEKQADLNEARRRGQAAVGAACELYEFNPETGEVRTSTPESWMELAGLSGEIGTHERLGVPLGYHIQMRRKMEKAAKKAGDVPGRYGEARDEVAKQFLRVVLDTATLVDPGSLGAGRRYRTAHFPEHADRRALLSRLAGIDPAEGELAARRLEQLRIVMDISEDLVRNKEHAAAGERTVPEEVIFEELGEMFAGSLEAYHARGEEWLPVLRDVYARLAGEGSLRVAMVQAPEAVRTWLDPPPEIVAHARRYDPELDNQNVRLEAMMLLRAAHDELPPEHWRRLVDSLPMEQRNDVENLARMLDWGRPGSGFPERGSPDPRQRSALLEGLAGSLGLMQRAWDGLTERFPLRTEDGRLLSFEPADAWLWATARLAARVDAVRRVHLEQGLRGLGMVAHGRVREWLHEESADHLGNLDALLNLARVYQVHEREDPAVLQRALEEAVVEELLSRMPIAGPARGLYLAAAGGDWSGLVTILSRMAGGPGAVAMAGFDVARSFVAVLGHEIFEPVRGEIEDVIVKGWVEDSSDEAGFLRAGRKVPEELRRSRNAWDSVLSRVPVRYLVLDGELLERLLEDASLPDQVAGALGEEVFHGEGKAQLGPVVVDLETPWRESVAELSQDLHELGSRLAGAEHSLERVQQEDLSHGLSQVLRCWERQLLLSAYLRERMRIDPRLEFEARRQNVFPYFEERVQRVFQAREQEPLTAAELAAHYGEMVAELRRRAWELSGTTLAEVSRKRAELEKEREALESGVARLESLESDALNQVMASYVDQWFKAQGDFSDLDQNIAMRFGWADAELRARVVARLAAIYRQSRRLALAGEGALDALAAMPDEVREQVLQRAGRRLAMALWKALPSESPPGTEAYLEAIGIPGDTPPHVDVDLSLVQERAPEGEHSWQLQIDWELSAIPEHFGEQSGPAAIEVVRARELPEAEIARFATGAGNIEAAYRVTVRVPGEGGREATGEAWFVKLRKAEEPPQQPADPEVPAIVRGDVALELRDPDGRSPLDKRTVLQEPRARIPLAGAGLEGELVLDLAGLPKEIIAGRDFRAAVALEFALAAEEPVQVVLVADAGAMDFHEERSLRSGGGSGRLEAVVDHDFAYKGETQAYWTWVYRKQSSSTTDRRNDSLREHWLRFQVRSEDPSFFEFEPEELGGPDFFSGGTSLDFAVELRATSGDLLFSAEVRVDYEVPAGT